MPEGGKYMGHSNILFHFVICRSIYLRLLFSTLRNRRSRERRYLSINSGLLALGNVISALGDPNQADIRLISRIETPNSPVFCKILLCLLAEYNMTETVNTLKYANRARNIKNNTVVNQEESGWNGME